MLEQEGERHANTIVRILNVQFDGNNANHEDQIGMMSKSPLLPIAVSSHLFGCGGALTVLSASLQQTGLELNGVRFDSNQGKCICPCLLRINPCDDALQYRWMRDIRFHDQMAARFGD